MLQLLHIENIAAIEKRTYPSAWGLNVLTGETGAGNRSSSTRCRPSPGAGSKELIRTGADAATVTAVFSGVDLSEWLDENGIEKEEDARCSCEK